ncbi:MAG: hypothetical protein Q8R00_02445 [Candidatus Nanoarchaeia archaeon]|nr:hypothetical protein [Candidatus Nanoarchaeia archaeon]
MKTLKTLTLMLLALMISTVAVFAASDDYDIRSVEVNDVDLNGATFDVERGEVLNIEVLIDGLNDVDDVRVKAEIDGYEHGDVEDRTSLFEVEAGKVYKKTLNLVVPNDIDASEDYTLKIKVSDKNNEEEFNVSLHIDEQRHNLGVFDVIVSPNRVEAGRPVFITALIENLGSKKEENVKVTASIPELGVVASGYVGELVTSLQEDAGTGDDDEEDSQLIDLTLRIPEDAESGNYNVVITVEFNRGQDVVTTTETISVDGVEKSNTETLISIDASSKDVKYGEESTYKLMIANIGTVRGIYSVEVVGTDLWATSRVEPAFITVDPDATGEAKVYLSAKKDAETGTHAFVVKVKEGKNIVSEMTLNANVVERNLLGGLRSALTAIFIVLVVVLVVLGIILAFKKMGSDSFDEEVMEPSITEGQTYYYYPRN